MQDIFTSIKAYLYDRAASPLIGAFVVAWAVWNYRFFVVLLSSGMPAPEDKFQAISHLFVASTFSIGNWNCTINGTLLDGVLIPATLTFIYLFIYPFLAKPVYEHSLKKQKELRAIKQEQDNQRLLSVEESRELYRRLAQMQSKHQSEIDNYNNQISSLNQHIEDLETSSSTSGQNKTKVSDAGSNDVGEVDLEEHDEFIRNSIEAYSEGSFQLNQLFGQDKWSSLPVSTRQALGKRFRAQVERGDFIGVSAIGKDSGNQQKYFKRVSG